MIEKKAIIPKDWPQRVRKRQRNVLILTLRKDMLLLSYPPLCGFYATTAAKARFTRLVNVFVMGAVSMTASILFRAKSSGTASEHLGDVFNDDGSEGFSVLIEVVQPSIVGIEELFDGLIRMHELYDKRSM
jgi:hypothetical protein